MNAPSPSSRRGVASPMSSAAHAPAIAMLARDTHAAANHDTVTAVPEQAINPLWMITTALAILFGAMAVLVATS